MTDSENTALDLLYGVPRIAAFLGLSTKATYHLVERNRIPHFRWGKTVCARRSALTAKIAELEAEASAE